MSGGTTKLALVEKGRVLAVENVFIGGSNELGALESGIAGQALGPAWAVVSGGMATLVIAGIWWVKFPVLRDVDRFERAGQPRRLTHGEPNLAGGKNVEELRWFGDRNRLHGHRQSQHLSRTERVIKERRGRRGRNDRSVALCGREAPSWSDMKFRSPKSVWSDIPRGVSG